MPTRSFDVDRLEVAGLLAFICIAGVVPGGPGGSKTLNCGRFFGTRATLTPEQVGERARSQPSERGLKVPLFG